MKDGLREGGHIHNVLTHNSLLHTYRHTDTLTPINPCRILITRREAKLVVKAVTKGMIIAKMAGISMPKNTTYLALNRVAR